MTKKRPFWETKKLAEMTQKEWESLCDGCARCCLNKYEEDWSKKIHFTDVSCKLLDSESCRCSDYQNRAKKVPDCVQLTPEIMDDMYCLPPTCAYRVLYEGGTLSWWHPLVSGDPNTVHEAGISVRGKCVSEVDLTERQIRRRIVRWPKQVPPKAREPR